MNLISFFYILYRFTVSSSLSLGVFNSLSIYQPFMMSLSKEVIEFPKTQQLKTFDNKLDFPNQYSLISENLSLSYNSQDKPVFQI